MSQKSYFLREVRAGEWRQGVWTPLEWVDHYAKVHSGDESVIQALVDEGNDRFPGTDGPRFILSYYEMRDSGEPTPWGDDAGGQMLATKRKVRDVAKQVGSQLLDDIETLEGQPMVNTLLAEAREYEAQQREQHGDGWDV
jgi:hypothetical protein